MRYLALLLLSIPVLSSAQKLENIKAAIAGDKIIVSYDITSTTAGEQYEVHLYASHNNFSAPLLRVNGDVGNKILPGTTKQIEWDAKTELKNFKGELTFEIWVDVVSTFAFKNTVKDGKKGKTLLVDWKGGAKNRDVKIELLKAGVVQNTLASVSNTGVYVWDIPKKQKSGKDYQLRLVNGKDEVKSETFSIKPKIPLLVKILPLVAAGVVVGVVAGGGGESGNPSGASKLPSPPDLGLN